ncbi:4486_t:CDS:2, partial [Gigaspora margarita]
DTNKLIKFLESQDLKLKVYYLNIIRNQELTGDNFLDYTEQKFQDCRLKLDLELQQFIKEVKYKLRNIKTILANSNEAMRCEYILSILYALLYIVKRITKKELSIAFQLEVVGKVNTNYVNYAIKVLKKLICITEGKLYQVTMGFSQNLVQCESASKQEKM